MSGFMLPEEEKFVEKHFTSNKPRKIRLVKRLGALKSNWFIWDAVKEEDGIETDGDVQADGSGEIIAEESFTPYD